MHKRVTTADERAQFFLKKSHGADVVLVADGGASGDRGGWGYAICQPDMKIIKEQYEVADEPKTSNNRMEIRAIMEGLATCYEMYGFDVKVHVRSDSQYAIGILTPIKKGWKFNASANLDLVEDARTVVLSSRGGVKYEWIPGHSGVCAVHTRVDKQISLTYNGGGYAVRNKAAPIKVRKKSVKGKYK